MKVVTVGFEADIAQEISQVFVECKVGSNRIRGNREDESTVILFDLDSAHLKELDTLLKRERHSAVIIFADNNHPELIAKGLSMGASDYLFKPYDQDELISRVTQASLPRHYVH